MTGAPIPTIDPAPRRAAYPFSAIVGQEAMKRALLIAAVDPGIGGVMVFGDRGTGKSTIVRALAALLPPMPAVAGCPFQCDPAARGASCGAACSDVPTPHRTHQVPTPVVDLPLGASEDRVVGALDIERALSLGERRFEPGLLARANRGFLYVDEINLLEDHLVDLLLDVAQTGENVVEREGLSVRHPARFVLIGSGNPEEGELRPQLLDRFGLAVDVRAPTDLADRVEVVRRRLAFDLDPTPFVARWNKDEAATRAAILKARTALPQVALPDTALHWAARICMALEVDGLRGELTLIRAARAAAALAGAEEVGEAHLRDVAAMALRHRLRRDPLDETGSEARIARALEDLADSSGNGQAQA